MYYTDPSGHSCDKDANDRHPNDGQERGVPLLPAPEPILALPGPVMEPPIINPMQEMQRAQQLRELSAPEPVLALPGPVLDNYVNRTSGPDVEEPNNYSRENDASGSPVRADFIVAPNGVVADASINVESIPKTQFTNQKLQHEFKHAGDFGVVGNWNKVKASEYQQAIQNHINSATNIYISKYRDTDVYVYYNDNTHVAAYVDFHGSYVGGWKLSSSQIKYHESNGIKIK